MLKKLGRLTGKNRESVKNSTGKRVVRTTEGAKKFGVPVGAPIGAAKAASKKPANSWPSRPSAPSRPAPPQNRSWAIAAAKAAPTRHVSDGEIDQHLTYGSAKYGKVNGLIRENGKLHDSFAAKHGRRPTVSESRELTRKALNKLTIGT